MTSVCVFFQLSPIKPADDELSLSDLDMVKVIGKGSSGVVQLVQHKWTGQFFALKVIQLNVDEAIRKSIAQELKINQSSQCPYLVTSYQSFYDNGAISLILEYMDGGSLEDFLKSVKTIPESYLSTIFKQVRSTIDAASMNQSFNVSVWVIVIFLW